MARRISWKGTTDEALALLQALRAHCTCKTELGRTVAPCAGHTMLAQDQRGLDRLLFMRRIAVRLLTEEFDVAAEAAPVVATPV